MDGRRSVEVLPTRADCFPSPARRPTTMVFDIDRAEKLGLTLQTWQAGVDLS